jgi:hypothetical protein
MGQLIVSVAYQWIVRSTRAPSGQAAPSERRLLFYYHNFRITEYNEINYLISVISAAGTSIFIP